ncbi:hypothetical protein PAU_01916 [Photorhabdus asymbiotica]|uniref:Uncharacterized protein n=1 Tax=Photorhabdus asymbiotica subsp. asymbiotica (strain ATCC 43949 / 3105-77) TaxID=553480 RepID=C7BHR1_PHOAA|nr:hypothetical protein PAU_01916 [Photorhabdus asymbiotica]
MVFLFCFSEYSNDPIVFTCINTQFKNAIFNSSVNYSIALMQRKVDK